MKHLTGREKVYEIINDERLYQDNKWPQNPPLPPSDEIRLIRTILAFTDTEWYRTQDKIIEGAKVNPADLDAMRKIAAIAVRCMETWGAIERPKL